MADLDSILSPEETQPDKVETETTAESTETETVVETEGETTAPDAEIEGKAEEKTDEKSEKAGLTSALTAERSKRQALEQQVRDLQPKVEKPDALLDPEGAMAHMQTEMDQKLFNNRADTSEMIHRGLHEDFEEMKALFFEEIAPNNAVISQQALVEADPYGFIYKTATEHAKLKKYGDLDKMEAGIRAEERAKVLAEVKAETDQKAETAAGIPSTLSTARAAGNNAKPAFVRPSLGAIIDKR